MPRKKKTEITTGLVKEIVRLSRGGLNDSQIGLLLDVSKSAVRNHRMAAGVPAPDRGAVVYTVWRAGTDELIVCGTAEECARKMGYANKQTFRRMAHFVEHGKCKRYDVAKASAFECNAEALGFDPGRVRSAGGRT